MDYVIHNLSIWVESLSVCLSDHRHARYLIYAQSWDTKFAVYIRMAAESKSDNDPLESSLNGVILSCEAVAYCLVEILTR